MRLVRRVLRLLLVPLVATAALQGQPAAAASAAPVRWIVTHDAASDLWFHSLALLRISGPGALPYYDGAYADTVVVEKRRRALPPTRLDREAAALRRALTADSAFELLHFLPFYLTRPQPQELTALLRRVATPAAPGENTEELTAALRSHFSRPSQRAVLVALADAIDDEWRSFFAAYSASSTTSQARRMRTLQARWDAEFAPRLDEWFRAMSIPRGVLLVTAGLGAEGRIVSLGDAGTVVAVSMWSTSTTPDAPLFAAVRELCFPALARARGSAPNAESGREGAAASSRAAVQCGALLLDALMPDLAGDYRSLFLSPRGDETAAQFRQRFDARFHVEPATLRQLSDHIARVAGATP